MSEPLTRDERATLLARLAEVDDALYPRDDPASAPSGPPRVKLLDRSYQILAEYGDRLPRVPMSRCPHTQQVLKRSFDPFGLDGPWWHKSRIVEIEEPPAPHTFKLILGALDLRGRTPSEAHDPVIPGPSVPFVVPRLLGLAGMKAVISRLVLETGDFAYPVAYFSDVEHAPARLHQHWLRESLWYPNDSGGTSWIMKNDVWDFDLARWVASGHLLWITPGDSGMTLRSGGNGGACPYLDLPGDREPQELSGGQRALMELPDGEPINPFE